MTLVPEGGIIVRAKLFIELDVPWGVYFYSSSDWVPAEFTVVGEFVPFVVDELAIMGGLLGVKI